jgi:hypothetical protein
MFTCLSGVFQCGVFGGLHAGPTGAVLAMACMCHQGVLSCTQQQNHQQQQQQQSLRIYQRKISEVVKPTECIPVF